MTLPLYLPSGRAAEGGDPVLVTPERAGWTFAGLRVIEFGPGESRTIRTGTAELAVVPLAGAAEVAWTAAGSGSGAARTCSPP